MATITSDTFLDVGAARTAGETWTCNGGKLTVRTDSRWHAQAPASMTGSLGSITISASLGGGILFDGTAVRWMPYNTGSGNVPAIGTSITQSGVTGTLLGVWANLTSAPTAVGAAMPTTGFIKFREVTGGTFSIGALTGIGANATGPDVTGWIEVVMDQAATITIPRKGSGHVTRGDWFYLDNTTGTVGQVLQVPTNGGGANTYCPGVWIETAPSSDEYAFWPALSGSTNGWSASHLGAPLGGTDKRQSFVKGIGSGQMQVGENVTQSSTYASVSQASTYTWANDIVTVTFTAHGLSIGEQVYLDFTSGGATADGIYTVEQVVSANAYTVVLTGAGTSGNVTAVSRTTVTFTAHALSVGQTIYCDATSGTLTDGTYEIMTVVDANSYRINTPIAPGASGNVNVQLTIGHIPPSGCRTRIPNVLGRQCTTGARATNARPHTTIATRPDYTTTGAGSIDHEYFYHDWYYSLAQPYAVRMHHVATFDSISISECASALDMFDGGLGMDAALDINTLVNTSNFAGGTIERWKFHRGNVPASNDHSVTLSLCIGQTFVDCEFGIIQTPRSTGVPLNLATCQFITVDQCHGLNGPMNIATCSDINIYDHDHIDRFIGVSNVVSGTYSFSVTSASARIMIDGVTEGYGGSVPRVHAPAGLITVASSNFVTLRNAGTRAAPLGTSVGVNQRAAVYVSGGNNTNIRIQRVYVTMVRTALITDVNSDKTVLYESVSAPHLSTFLPYTFAPAALNATIRGCKAPLNGVAANNSVYGTHMYDQFSSWFRLLSTYTWASNILTITSPTHGLSVGDKVYLAFTSGGASASGVYTVKTVTSSTGFTVALAGSGTSGNVVVYRNMLSTPANLFTTQGRIAIPMNEPTTDTSGYVTVVGSAQFTSVPGLTFPADNDEVVVETQYFIKGHTGFPNIPVTQTGTPTLAQASSYTWSAGTVTVTFTAHGLAVGDKVYLLSTTGTLPSGLYTVATTPSANVYTISLPGSGTSGNATAYVTVLLQYQIDKGGGYSGWKNLSRRKFGGATTSGSTIITMNDTTSVAVNDYVYGIGVGVDARVVSVDSSTQITVDVNSVATGTALVLEFNSLPNEDITVSPFRLKVSLKADTPGTKMIITYLTIPTITTAAAQDSLYPLDTTNLTFTGLPLNTDIVVLTAGTNSILAQQDSNPTSSYTFTYEGTPTVDVGFIKTGFVPLYIRNLSLTSTNSSIPVAMTVDRNFI